MIPTFYSFRFFSFSRNTRLAAKRSMANSDAHAQRRVWQYGQIEAPPTDPFSARWAGTVKQQCRQYNSNHNNDDPTDDHNFFPFVFKNCSRRILVSSSRR